MWGPQALWLHRTTDSFLSADSTRVLREEALRSVPTQFLQILCPKCVVSLLIGYYLRVLGDYQEKHQ